MKKISTIIIDDEINARENLRYLVKKFCEEINIISEASNVDEAIIAIEKFKPKLIFLDIEMPQKNGFQLINHFKTIDFKIIFITAYDRYAIQAFKYSALDYILKPIDVIELKKAIKKVTLNLEKENLIERLKILTNNQKQLKNIAIPYKSDYVIIDISTIIYIAADRMYSHISLTNGKTYTASKKLSYYEELLLKNNSFMRVHRSWIVNCSHIKIYSKKEKNITLSNNLQIPVSKSYKENFESIFKTN